MRCPSSGGDMLRVLRLVAEVGCPQPDREQHHRERKGEEPCAPVECDVVAVDAGIAECCRVDGDRVAGGRIDRHSRTGLAGERLRDDGTQQSQPDRSADLLARVQQCAGHTGVAFLDPVQAETIVNASQQGRLSLALRSIVDFAKNNSDGGNLKRNAPIRIIRYGQDTSVVAGQAPSADEASVNPANFRAPTVSVGRTVTAE